MLAMEFTFFTRYWVSVFIELPTVTPRSEIGHLSYPSLQISGLRIYDNLFVYNMAYYLAYHYGVLRVGLYRWHVALVKISSFAMPGWGVGSSAFCCPQTRIQHKGRISADLWSKTVVNIELKHFVIAPFPKRFRQCVKLLYYTGTIVFAAFPTLLDSFFFNICYNGLLCGLLHFWIDDKVVLGFHQGNKWNCSRLEPYYSLKYTNMKTEKQRSSSRIFFKLSRCIIERIMILISFIHSFRVQSYTPVAQCCALVPTECCCKRAINHISVGRMVLDLYK